jgi:YVTN family beta-propeller protein
MMDSFSTTYILAGRYPDHLAVTPDGSRVYVSHWSNFEDSNVVSLIDTTKNAVVAAIQLDSNPDCMVVNPEGARLYASHYQSQKGSVIDTSSNAVVTTIPFTGYPRLLAVTPDGAHVYVAHHYYFWNRLPAVGNEAVCSAETAETRSFVRGRRDAIARQRSITNAKALF